MQASVEEAWLSVKDKHGQPLPLAILRYEFLTRVYAYSFFSGFLKEI